MFLYHQNNFLYNIKKIYQEKIPPPLKGIKSSLDAVTVYSSELVKFVENFKEKILINLNKPIGLCSVQKLKIIQQNILNETIDEQFLNYVSIYSPYSREPIIDKDVFLKLEKHLQKFMPLANSKIAFELQQTHNKLLFDCLNESLDHYRVYGIKGIPLEWRPRSQKIKIIEILPSQFNKILQESQQRVIDNASYMCGFINDKQDEFININEEQLMQIREDRMARMLAQEVYDHEDIWIHYDEEEAELAIEISDIVFEHLIGEVAEELSNLVSQRNSQHYFNLNQ